MTGPKGEVPGQQPETSRASSRPDRRKGSLFGDKPLFEPAKNTLYGINIPYYTHLEETGFSLQGIPEAREGQDLADQTIVVVGVRENGLGEAGLLAAAAQGAKVVGVSRQPAESESVSNLMRKAADISGREALWIPVDVTEEGATEKIVGTTLERFGRIDGMVMAVAHRDDRAFIRFTQKEIARELKVNQEGPLLIMHAVLKQMVRQRSGRFVYLSSVAAAQSALQPFYAAPKAFFESLIKDVALELDYLLGEGKVTVNALAPGFVPGTDLVKDVDGEQERDIIRMTGAERPLLAAEVGEAIAHLLSPKMNKSGRVISMVGMGPELKVDERGLLKVA